ncbi:MAG: CBS domain containing-hemolysin-like protein [Gammaproteobacteria bacterium]|jgi:CBS domain containing-hemolysin-like protein
MMTLLNVFLLLAANAFFVAAEFALVKARGFRLDALADEGRFGAKLSTKIASELEPYLAACQLGITMASLGLGWVGEPAVAALLTPALSAAGLSPDVVHTIAFIVGFIVFSSLHIVVGEQVPKTLAIRKPEPVSLIIAYPLRVFFVMIFPLNWLLNEASKRILRLFGVAEVGHGEILTGDEIQSLVGVSHAHGVIEPKQATMLANLFAFDARTVGRVMIPRRDVHTLNVQASNDENMRVSFASGHSRFPILDGTSDVPCGVLIAKSFYASLLSEGAPPWDRLAELSRIPLVVSETMRIAALFEKMRSEREHLAIVVDEYGGFIGIVTLEDLIEEIVGEIGDELDELDTHYPITDNTDGTWSVHGLASLADVERATGLVVPDGLDANTLSGLFLQRLARIPAVGDTIQEGDFEIVVNDVAEHHVLSVTLRENPTPDSPENAGTKT